MKLRTITFFLIFFIITTYSGYSQSVVAQRQAVTENTVPKLILTKFQKQYPELLLSEWYSTHLIYWQNDYSSDWYYNWYGQRTVVVYTYQKPNYYEVEFVVNPGEISRAIYNINGYWYETRTMIKGLTEDILNAIKASEYRGWKISKTMEKLESPMWPVEIYRFNVTKGLKSQTIRMDADGNLIQIKVLKD